jgi:hypothetical protein
MKKIITTVVIVLILLINSKTQAQDILTLRNGDEIKSKVVEITATQIKYHKFENLDGPIYTIEKADALFVKYPNGTKEVFAEVIPAIKPEKQTISPTGTTAKITTDTPIDNYCEKGKSDAKIYYTGQHCGSTGTIITSIVASPLIGLIPYAACSSVPPKPENLNYPSVKLYENMDYRNCYTTESHTIKKQKHNLALSISSLIWLGLILISYSAQ